MDEWVEETFILRVPNEMADTIRERIKTDNFDGFELELGDGKQKRDMFASGFSVVCCAGDAQLKLGGESFPGTRTILPGYVEAFKTFDQQNYYKSADISQVRPHLFRPIAADGVVPPAKMVVIGRQGGEERGQKVASASTLNSEPNINAD